MARRRFALIAYDPDRVAQWNVQAEGQSLAWMFTEALNGRDHVVERGVERITLMDPLATARDRRRLAELVAETTHKEKPRR